MITTNGFPKSGNHALVKAMQLLGQPCQVQHLPFGSEIAGKHLFVKRDPRNVVCSWLRFNGQPVTPGMFITGFRDFEGQSLVAAMAEYEGWLSDSGTLVVRYEDLTASDATMRALSAHVGAPYIDGAFEALPGLTRTWYAEHSDYNKVWTSEVAAAWSVGGGSELLARWGY